MTENFLGKIENISLGAGGYQDAMFGVTFKLSGSAVSVCDFWGYWNTEITSSTKWSEEHRTSQLGEIMNRLRLLMNEAKVREFTELKGVPVEVRTLNGALVGWRVLTEVL